MFPRMLLSGHALAGTAARHGRPFVNRYHREQSGEVVIVIDTFRGRLSGPATGSGSRVSAVGPTGCRPRAVVSPATVSWKPCS